MHLIPLLILLVWLKPDLILTHGRVNALFDKYAVSYFSKKPESIRLEITSPSFLKKHVLFESPAFCLKEPDACFSSVHLEATIKLVGIPKVRLEDVGPISIQNEYVRIVPKPETKPKPEPTPSAPSDKFVLSPNLEIKDVDIRFPDFTLKQERETITGGAMIRKNQSDQLTLSANASSNQSMRLRALVQTAFSQTRSNPFQAKLHYQMGEGPHPKIVDANLGGTLNWNNLQGDIGGQIQAVRMVPWLERIALQNLQVHRRDRLRLTAGIELDVEPQIPPQRRSALPSAAFHQTLNGKVEANENNGKVNYLVHIGPVPQQGVVFETRAEGNYPYDPKDKQFYGLDRFFIRLAVPEFQKIVRRFRNTSMAVPAPFNALTGSMEFVVGEVDKNLEGAALPLRFDTKLTSPEQAILTQTRGGIQYYSDTGRLKIDGETHLHQVKVTMPDLKMFEPMPMINFDPRIVSHRKIREQREEREVSKKAEPSKVDFSWKMTSDPGAVQIYHPILKPYAPIDVNWTVGKNPTGEISMRPFDVEYLNRTAKIDRMRFYQNAETGKFDYEGRLHVDKTDYTIFIDVFESNNKPKIQFTSDPPLAESDIISLLLFNETTAALDGDQSNSVGSTQSAIENRALGVFSVLALSSTPVEAVNFNPATGVYSARVKLASGLTATVGTNWDQTQEVALRKRLGRNWVLETILQTDSGDTGDSRKTLLEWFRRF